MRFDKRESKKAKSGYTWRVTFDYNDQYGARKRHSKSGFSTKKEAQAYAVKTLDELEKGVQPKTKGVKLDTVFEEWLAITPLRENTVTAYTSSYRNHISPVLGSVPISQIKYVELQNFFNGLDLGKSTTAMVQKVLKQIGTHAVRSGYIEDWPLEYVEVKPRQQEKKTDRSEYVTKEELEQMVTLILDQHEGGNVFLGGARVMFLYLCYFLGLRRSEALALEFSDFSEDYSTVSIQRQLTGFGHGKEALRSTTSLKTAASEGTIIVPKALREKMIQWQAYNPYPLVLCSEAGDYLNPGYLSTAIKRIVSSVIPHFHTHMLRHTYVTNLVMAGADPKTAASLARHKNVTTTLEIYTEISAKRKADIVGRAFD